MKKYIVNGGGELPSEILQDAEEFPKPGSGGARRSAIAGESTPGKADQSIRTSTPPAETVLRKYQFML